MSDLNLEASGQTGPATGARPVVPSDSVDLPAAARAIYIGAGGDLALRLLDGEEVTLNNVVAGMIYPIRFAGVLATGTTASNLVALW